MSDTPVTPPTYFKLWCNHNDGLNNKLVESAIGTADQEAAWAEQILYDSTNIPTNRLMTLAGSTSTAVSRAWGEQFVCSPEVMFGGLQY